MEIFVLVRNLFEVGLQFFLTHKMIAVIWILFCTAIFFVALWDKKDDLKEDLKPIMRFCIYLYMVVSVLYVFFLGSVFAVAADVFVANPGLFSTRLYIVVIIISILDGILRGIALHRASANTANDDDLGEIFKEVIKSGVVVVVSTVFIFTDLEFGIINWGFTLFGRTIGGWIFNLYSGWALARFLGFVQFLLQWPFFRGVSMAFDD